MGYYLKLDRIIIYLIIMKQPHTGSFLIFRRSLTRTYHQSNPTPVPFLSEEVLHGLIIKVTLHRFLFFQKKSYTDLSQGNPTPVPPKVLHGLISR